MLLVFAVGIVTCATNGNKLMVFSVIALYYSCTCILLIGFVRTTVGLVLIAKFNYYVSLLLATLRI